MRDDALEVNVCKTISDVRNDVLCVGLLQIDAIFPQLMNEIMSRRVTAPNLSRIHTYRCCLW